QAPSRVNRSDRFAALTPYPLLFHNTRPDSQQITEMRTALSTDSNPHNPSRDVKMRMRARLVQSLQSHSDTKRSAVEGTAGKERTPRRGNPASKKPRAGRRVSKEICWAPKPRTR